MYIRTHVTHNGRHDKVLVHEAIAVVVAFEHLEVPVVSDLTSDLSGNRERKREREGEKHEICWVMFRSCS